MTELTGMTCEELTAWVKEQGYPAFRGKQIFRWIHQGADFDGMTNLSKDMREELVRNAVAQPVTIGMTRQSELDGTVKFQNEDGSFKTNGSVDYIPVSPDWPGYSEKFKSAIVNDNGPLLKVR